MSAATVSCVCEFHTALKDSQQSNCLLSTLKHFMSTEKREALKWLSIIILVHIVLGLGVMYPNNTICTKIIVLDCEMCSACVAKQSSISLS